MARQILRPPRLRTTETEAEHRQATWLELFYDLVFVVAVANLGSRLHGDVSWGGVGAFIGLFIPLWWAWAGFTFYADRYDTDDLGQRLLAVAQIVSIALLAASISGDKADSTAAFAVAYVLARLVLIAMYSRARKHVPDTQPLVSGYMKGFSIGAALWLVSVFTPEPWRYVLWTIGLIIDFGTPYHYRRLQAKVPLSVSHLPERFGLFTILVFGESIAAVVIGLSHEEWAVRPTVAGILGVLAASSLWWLYFDNLDGSVVRRRAEQTKAWKPTAWIYSHLPLAISLTATGIGLEFVTAETGHHLPTAERWLVFGGVAAALLTMAMIHIATESASNDRRDTERARLRIAGAAAALLLAIVVRDADALVVGIVLAVLAVSLVAADVWITITASPRRDHQAAGRSAD